MLFSNPSNPPLVAILRGITPREVLPIAGSLIEAGWRYIEIPLNSPDPFTSIKKLCDQFGNDAYCGAGTVLSSEDVRRVHGAGAKIALAPNTNPEVIQTGLEFGLHFVPGISTPTDAFTAIQAGAKTLKLFPATSYGSSYIKAVRAVLPPKLEIIAVGGIDETELKSWQSAGITGFGIGSHVYKPGMTARDCSDNAKRILKAYQS